MLNSLFLYRDYRAFLKDQIEVLPNKGRGGRSALAKFIGCQLPFISHVLYGYNDFSQEQAVASARFFNLTAEETEYFLLLVSFNRAGTKELKKVLEQLLDARTNNYKNLKNQLRIEENLNVEDQLKYYSHWLYVATHMALTIPTLQTAEQLSKRFKVSKNSINEVLEFLVTRGFASKEAGVYKAKKTVLHLEKAAPALLSHHTNWRHRATTALFEEKENDLHYSGVLTCSERDMARVREIIAKALADSIDIIKPSPEESIFGLCLDVFEL